MYEDALELFKKTFDVPKLCFDIISRIKNPATCGKLYDVEVVNVSRELFKIKIEFKTNEDTYFDITFNLENTLGKAEDFCGSMGFSLDTIVNSKGRKYKVFYANMFETVVIGNG